MFAIVCLLKKHSPHHYSCWCCSCSVVGVETFADSVGVGVGKFSKLLHKQRRGQATRAQRKINKNNIKKKLINFT